MKVRFERFLSVDSAKAIKAQTHGYLNGINYMAPHKSGGKGNLCAGASLGCIAACLGLHSGQAAMVDKVTQDNAVRASRRRKAAFFFENNGQYMLEFALHIARLVRTSKRLRLIPAVRPNGCTDIPYERIRFYVSAEFAATLSAVSGMAISEGLHTLFTLYPAVQFIDYTKIASRFDAPLPSNYSLTFSLSEVNKPQALALLAKGVNVAVCFYKALPETWNGYTVINGDAHDLRHLDPKGVVVGLLPKGRKMLADKTGMMVRDHLAA